MRDSMLRWFSTCFPGGEWFRSFDSSEPRGTTVTKLAGLTNDCWRPTMKLDLSVKSSASIENQLAQLLKAVDQIQDAELGVLRSTDPVGQKTSSS